MKIDSFYIQVNRVKYIDIEYNENFDIILTRKNGTKRKIKAMKITKKEGKTFVDYPYQVFLKFHIPRLDF